LAVKASNVLSDFMQLSVWPDWPPVTLVFATVIAVAAKTNQKEQKTYKAKIKPCFSGCCDCDHRPEPLGCPAAECPDFADHLKGLAAHAMNATKITSTRLAAAL